jgi:hypothetical protein
MSTKARWVALMAALFLVGVGNAGEPIKAEKPVDPEPSGIDFVALDKDANGSLSKSEMLAWLDAVFARLDYNRDEALTPAEYSRWSHSGNISIASPVDPATAPRGSAGAQHTPYRD